MSSALLKKLAFVTAILLAAWALYVYQQVPHQKAPFAKAMNQAAQIVLEQGPNRVELHKAAGHWSVGSLAGSSYAVEENLIGTLVDGLKDVQVEDKISDRTDRAADYDLTPESRMGVSILNEKGAKLAEGFFGKQAPDFAHSYFQYPDKPNVYLVSGLIRGDLGKVNVNFWRSRQLTDIPETKIQGILIEGKEYKTDLVRTSTDTWTLNGKSIDPASVDRLVGALAHLRADEFIDPGAYPALTYGSLTYASVRIKGTDSSTELRLGAQDVKSKRYPASVGQQGGLAWLSEPSVLSILQKPSAFTKKS